MMLSKKFTPKFFNDISLGSLPGHLGLNVTRVASEGVEAELKVIPSLLAINGYLHAGSIVTLADTCAGYGSTANLPEGAIGFTTIELKSNHIGTAREGTIRCVATPAHLGKSTQVWDAIVSHDESGKTVAIFRCTQMVLYPK